MISFLIKYKKSILIITLAFFVASIGYLGLNSFNSGAFNTNAAVVGKDGAAGIDERRKIRHFNDIAITDTLVQEAGNEDRIGHGIGGVGIVPVPDLQIFVVLYTVPQIRMHSGMMPSPGIPFVVGDLDLFLQTEHHQRSPDL